MGLVVESGLCTIHAIARMYHTATKQGNTVPLEIQRNRRNLSHMTHALDCFPSLTVLAHYERIAHICQYEHKDRLWQPITIILPLASQYFLCYGRLENI